MRRSTIIALTLVSLVIAWVGMAAISRTDPWYRNTDMNMHNLVDALSFNADVRPNPFAQPALPLKYLLALDYRIRHELGVLRVWNLRRFGASASPLQEIPPLIRIERIHNRILVIVFIISAGWLTYSVTGRFEVACFTVILLCGSTGLLFHGLLVRPELLCVGFGNVFALLCTWRAVMARSWLRNHAWLFLAGALVGLATLEKLPGVCYGGLCYGWCWIGALTFPTDSATAQSRSPAWGGLLAAAGGAAGLGLLFLLGDFHHELSRVAIARLRIAAVLVAVLPLVATWKVRNRTGRFLLVRGRELALLGGGFLSALLVSFLLVRCVLSEANARDYFASVLDFVINPVPHLRELLNAKPETVHVFGLFINQTPILFLGATVAAIGLGLIRSISLRDKAFIALLWVGGVGMALVMSKRHYQAQYDIFLQVPMLLIVSLSIVGVGITWRKRPQTRFRPGVTSLAFAGAFLLGLTTYSRLEPIYYHFQDDVALPVNDLTLTFLFDHDAHDATYLNIMKTHYGSREQFAATLARYLADPANRH